MTDTPAIALLSAAERAPLTIAEIDAFIALFGLDAAAICKKAGIHPNTLRNWRAGGTPSLATYEKIRLALLECAKEKGT